MGPFRLVGHRDGDVVGFAFELPVIHHDDGAFVPANQARDVVQTELRLRPFG